VLESADVEQHLRLGSDSLMWCCVLLVGGGAHAIVATPVPTRAARDQLRDALPALVEIFLDAPAALCAERSGRSDEEFEEPYAADLRVPTHDRDAAASIAQAVSFLETIGAAPRDPVHPSERQP
jgi:adenylylsulfate kinase-like enzyme